LLRVYHIIPAKLTGKLFFHPTPHRNSKGTLQEEVLFPFGGTTENASDIRWNLMVHQLVTSGKTVMRQVPKNDLHFIWSLYGPERL
jgi:hypothetical protein